MHERFDYYGVANIEREMAERSLTEARGVQAVSLSQMVDLKRDPKAKQMAVRGAAGGAFAGYETKTFPSREALVSFLKKDAGHPEHGALGRRDWKALIKDKVAKNMVAYPSYQEEQVGLSEARSAPVKGKPGKYKYQGKVGVWRTLPNGDKVFFPDDKSGPLAMRGPTKEKGKKPGLLKRIGGAIKRAFTREELENELAVLEAGNSPFPEVRERRIQELKAELEEAEKPFETMDGKRFVSIEKAIQHADKMLGKKFPEYIYRYKKKVYALYPDGSQGRVEEAHGQGFKFKVGDRIKDLEGNVGTIQRLDPGYPHDAYIIKVEKSRYREKGSTLAVPEHSMLKKV